MVDELELLLNRRALATLGKHRVEVDHVGHLACGAHTRKLGDAVRLDKPHPPNNGRQLGNVGGAAQGVGEQCRHDGVALEHQHFEARRREQEGVLTQARRGIDRIRRTGKTLEPRGADEQLAVEVGGFEAREHPGEVAPQLHAPADQGKTFGVETQGDGRCRHLGDRSASPHRGGILGTGIGCDLDDRDAQTPGQTLGGLEAGVVLYDDHDVGGRPEGRGIGRRRRTATGHVRTPPLPCNAGPRIGRLGNRRTETRPSDEAHLGRRPNVDLRQDTTRRQRETAGGRGGGVQGGRVRRGRTAKRASDGCAG